MEFVVLNHKLTNSKPQTTNHKPGFAKGDGASELDSDDAPIPLRKAKPTGAGDAAAPRKLKKASA